MNARERVKRTLEQEGPDRVPQQLWILPWAEDRYPEEVKRIKERFPDDLIAAPAYFREEPIVKGERYLPGTYVDEWGCVFENVQKGIIGEVKAPLLTTWDRVDEVRMPKERLTVDVEKVNAFCRNTDRFIVTGCFPRPFERLQFIRGTENLLLDLMDQPEELFVLLNRMHDFYLKELELWSRTEVDALFFMDDWGAQNNLLIAPDLWRKVFKPMYRDYVDLAHERGKYLFMHSDGHILEIIPDLVEMGLDALNSQIFCMGVETLGARFKGKITFWGELDRQHILPYGTVEEVHEAVRRMREAFYHDGGIIAQCEFGIGAKPENVFAFFEAWE
jgi:hypothetical protein